jgi:hypothetical protein
VVIDSKICVPSFSSSLSSPSPLPPSKGKFSEKRAKRCGKRWREYVVHDWALIYQAHACHIANTAKALDLGRNTLLRYLKEDNEIKAAFNDVRLTEYDDVRLELVKLALDGHFHAIRYYLELPSLINLLILSLYR